MSVHFRCIILHKMSTVKSAIDHIGPAKLAERLDFYPSAITKWRKASRLPRTELAGLTNYAEIMEEMSGGKFTASALIEDTRRQWKRHMRTA